MFPADVIKSRIQAQQGNGFYHTARQLFASEGIRGLYRGCGITIARSIPTSGLMFLVYEWTLKAAQRET
ncbi:hypothetical protein O9G_001367 [Rozella allomycis CSF55]|uniref:Mitochondrial carrier domain-containing protein n=1 Tax=Rozella allomycis (strain CSF55) TaxID=988480 RepID=A0A075AQM0_ROZAC|nr:hypothetical protein O9G_001367 [Rozella allomycis CSF55]|eukprot:EPZ32465.1 hypothetical protein O9G_001367 [Rozella allomycis CSF55]